MPSKEFRAELSKLRRTTENVVGLYEDEIQKIVNKHKVTLVTGHMSTTWQIYIPKLKTYMSELDFELEKKRAPKIFKDLKRLDDMVEQYNIGPTNLLRYTPEG